ncbi:MAG: hypothetical protein Q4D82_01540 [Neisseria sp.]|nr:hypothetical protein [Neisseria sp.]
MKLWLISIIVSINALCNFVLWFWICYFSLHAIRKDSIPIIKGFWRWSMIIALLGVLFIPSKEALNVLLG